MIVFDSYRVLFEYGCSTHPLNNLCENIVKISCIKPMFESSKYVSKRIKHRRLLSKIFGRIFSEQLRQSYLMALYTAFRWSTINVMFRRLKKVNRPINALSMIEMNEKEEQKIDNSFKLLSDFSREISNPKF